MRWHGYSTLASKSFPSDDVTYLWTHTKALGMHDIDSGTETLATNQRGKIETDLVCRGHRGAISMDSSPQNPTG